MRTTLLLFTLFWFLFPAPLSSQNLIQNGGFESGTTGWSPILSNAALATIATSPTTTYSGGKSLQLTISGGDAVAGMAQQVAILPHHHYLLECAVRAKNANGLVLPYINLNSTEPEVLYGMMPVTGTGNWTVLRSAFVAPADVTSITVFMFLTGSQGSGFFDEIRLTELPVAGDTWFTVKMNEPAGVIKPLMGVNAGPLYPFSAQDLTAEFQNTGVSFVRTHDFYGPCDLHTIFPDVSKDPLDPTAYQFASTDAMINGIVNSGAKVLFRLGESYSDAPVNNLPPADPDRMAAVCLQIYKHYNEGWNNGYFYDMKHWEVWNEPDSWSFWGGTAVEFADLYCKIAQKLKTYDAAAQIGGPAVASIANQTFIHTFLDTVATRNAPLDFFSYHVYYAANPAHFAVMDSTVSTLLAAHGLDNTPHFLTEWNNFPYDIEGNIDIWRDDPFHAASTAATLSTLQSTDVTESFRYRADELLFGLFDENGDYTYPGLAYKAFGQFRYAPVRHTTTGNDGLGRTILAGANATGDTVHILIADPSSNAVGYQVQLSGLSNGEWQYHTFRIDSTHAYTEVQEGSVYNSHPFLHSDAVPPFVEHIILSKTSTSASNAPLGPTFIVSAAPNPARDRVAITCTGSAIITITDATGKLIAQRQVDNGSASPTAHYFDCSSWPSGRYFYRVQAGEQVGGGVLVRE